ncbi:MAG: hypothetical protein IT236_12035, partial [Bacteroidia bacterium]|nr:hypothetical protein [Bacteroidia bacterium]
MALYRLSAGVNSHDKAGTSLPSSKTETLTFTENKGQISDQNAHARPDVLYSGQINGMVYHLKKNGISYQLSRVDRWKDKMLTAEPKQRNTLSKRIPAQTTVYRLDIQWVRANPLLEVTAEKCREGFGNYYLKTCPQGVLGVRSYESLWFKNLYAGIDLHYYQKDHGLKYDYVVKPGVDYKQIRMEVAGATNIAITSEGSLRFTTPLGVIEEGAPLVFQGEKQLLARWILEGTSIGFDITDVDRNQAIVIDPAIRLWGSYYGGNNQDDSRSCASDNQGNAYIVGFTESTTGTIIATSGSHQTVFGGDLSDAYVAKFNPSG